MHGHTDILFKLNRSFKKSKTKERNTQRYKYRKQTFRKVRVSKGKWLLRRSWQGWEGEKGALESEGKQNAFCTCNSTKVSHDGGVRKRLLNWRTLRRNSSRYTKSKSPKQYIQQNGLTRTHHTATFIKNRERPEKLSQPIIAFGELRKNSNLHTILEWKKSVINN